MLKMAFKTWCGRIPHLTWHPKKRQAAVLRLDKPLCSACRSRPAQPTDSFRHTNAYSYAEIAGTARENRNPVHEGIYLIAPFVSVHGLIPLTLEAGIFSKSTIVGDASVCHAAIDMLASLAENAILVKSQLLFYRFRGT